MTAVTRFCKSWSIVVKLTMFFSDLKNCFRIALRMQLQLKLKNLKN